MLVTVPLEVYTVLAGQQNPYVIGHKANFFLLNKHAQNNAPCFMSVTHPTEYGKNIKAKYSIYANVTAMLMLS